ncbi:MAG: anti-sigma factor [Betaproteobacteria bacterium]
MKLAKPDLRDRLAAEFVLGTMNGRTRRRFQEYMKRDPALQSDVSRWEAHLMPLAGRMAAVDPPARVWRRIEAALDGSRSMAAAKAKPGLLQSLGLWRAVGLGATALAAVLLVTVASLKPPVEQEPMLMAVLAEDNSDARVYIEQPKSNLLMVKMIKPWKQNPSLAHELWVIPRNGAPRSLGVINAATDTKISLAGLDSKLADGALLAVSLEPPGGSPSGVPTGKVVCKGSIAWMPPKTQKAPAQI